MTLGNKCPISLRKTLRLLLAAAAMPVGAYAQTTITFQQGTAGYLGAVDRNLTATTATADVALGQIANSFNRCEPPQNLGRLTLVFQGFQILIQMLFVCL